LARRRKWARTKKEGAHFMLDAREKVQQSSKGVCWFHVFGPARSRDFFKILCVLNWRRSRERGNYGGFFQVLAKMEKNHAKSSILHDF